MNNETKLLTDKEIADIIGRAGDEIECSDAYKHFLEDMAELVTKHFGGLVSYVNGPIDEEQYEERHRCDSCGDLYIVNNDGGTGVSGHMVPLEECKDLAQRLTPGCPTPSGECTKCGAFVYAESHIDSEWVVCIEHNECVPADGGVFKDYDTDINWEEEEEENS